METVKVIVLWFPPDGDKTKSFDTVEAAQRWADKQTDWDFWDWHPAIFQRITTVVEDVLPNLVRPAGEQTL